MFNTSTCPLAPSRDNFYHAYHAIRLERRYANHIARITRWYELMAPGMFAAEAMMAESRVGERTKKNCSPILYQAVLAAMWFAQPVPHMTAQERLAKRREWGIKGLRKSPDAAS